MRFAPLTLLPLLLAGSTALRAQEPHFGFALNMVFPTGEFREKSYPPTATVHATQTEGYDLGLGGQFTMSFPVDPKLAIRLNLGGQTCNGSNTAPGYERINLRHSIFSVGGELQFFTDSAFRHRGTYFILGASADFERFDSNLDDDYHYYWDDGDTTRKSRMGAVGGIGHSIAYGGGGRFTFEVVFHKTISGNSTREADPPSTDFVKASFGWVF